MTANPHILKDGNHIAVVGGGPSGSFFSIFVLKMAKIMGKEFHVTVYEPKDFTKEGPLGCNRCGGIISELLVQMLAVEGINLPDSVVQRGINAYRLHTNEGSVDIATPAHEKTIATVYRGGGPRGTAGIHKESFDKFLLDLAIKEGAAHEVVRIDRIAYTGKGAELFAKEQKICETDLLVGSIGIKSRTSEVFEAMEFGYRRPVTTTASIAEISMDEAVISECLGNSVHLFLLPVSNIKFAAMIPKGTYVTVCILGEALGTETVSDFLAHPVVGAVLPDRDQYSIECRCLPLMNVRAPKTPFHERVVICGDAGSTRLFKDGLGASYIMGKAAAKTVVFHGAGKSDFQREYYPVYKSLIVDNRYGNFLFRVTDIVKKHSLLTKGMLEVVRKEQAEAEKPAVLSSILWDMFTGNERYRNIFMRSLHVPMFYDLLKGIARV